MQLSPQPVLVAGVPRSGRFAEAVARALALFFGGFSLLNLAGGFRLGGFDANLWWVDLRAFSEPVGRIFLVLASLCLVGFGIRPPRPGWRRGLTAFVTGALAFAVLWNVVEFYYLFAQGRVRPRLPVPLSLLVLAALALILRINFQSRSTTPSAGTSLGMLAAFCFCLVAFPLAQMICFGNTDYRRPADVAVVFGARTYADGRPSDALKDRVRTACKLYRDGLVKKLIFSGGPGDGKVHETEAMRRMALQLGVKPKDILTDTNGLNTQATVKDTERIFAQLGARRILVVSHFYHLPRIKMAYRRAGWEVYTVPAKESYYLGATPYFMAREVAALWVYYLRPLTRGAAG